VKMIHGVCALLLLSVLAGQAFVQIARPAKITLVETGDFFYNEEVTVKNGERVLGLYVTEGGSSLIESRIRLKPAADPTAPAGEKQMTGVSINVDQPGKPVFLVKGAAVLKPGPTSTIYLGGEAKEHELVNTENLASSKPRKLKLGAKEYQLKVLVRKARTVETLSPDCVELKMALVFDKKTQVLSTEQDVDPVNSPRTWKLLWAGDVDGDGNLDLYVNLSSDGVGDEMKLFLSSQAKPGQLVREIVSSAGGN
jgi:uncharacterized protein YneR